MHGDVGVQSVRPEAAVELKRVECLLGARWRTQRSEEHHLAECRVVRGCLEAEVSEESKQFYLPLERCHRQPGTSSRNGVGQCSLDKEFAESLAAICLFHLQSAEFEALRRKAVLVVVLVLEHADPSEAAGE